jgi:hypothetical protein
MPRERPACGDIRMAAIDLICPRACANHLAGALISMVQEVQQRRQHDHVAEATESNDSGMLMSR